MSEWTTLDACLDRKGVAVVDGVPRCPKCNREVRVSFSGTDMLLWVMGKATKPKERGVVKG